MKLIKEICRPISIVKKINKYPFFLFALVLLKIIKKIYFH